MTRFRCPSRSMIRHGSLGSMENVAAPARSRDKGKRRALTRVETIEDVEAAGTNANHAEPSPQPGPSRPSKKGKGNARATAKVVALRREEVLRKQIKKTVVQVQTNRDQWSFVFVGNLTSSTVNEDLYKHFVHCGPIVDIQIRASGGVCVPTAKLPTPYWGMGASLESVHYATIRFKTPDAARNAIDLSGTELLGKKIIVTFNAIDLPETINIVRDHLKKKHLPPDNSKPSFWQSKYGQLKRLTIEKTEPDISEGSAGRPGAAKLAAGLGRRVGVYTAGGSTAARDQNRHAPRWPLLLADQISFPKTLI